MVLSVSANLALPFILLPDLGTLSFIPKDEDEKEGDRKYWLFASRMQDNKNP